MFSRLTAADEDAAVSASVSLSPADWLLIICEWARLPPPGVLHRRPLNDCIYKGDGVIRASISCDCRSAILVSLIEALVWRRQSRNGTQQVGCFCKTTRGHFRAD